MSGIVLTKRQIEFARHALGLPNRKNETNRNHFCIGQGGDGYKEWEEMVENGLAIKRTGPRWGGDDMFHLSLTGAKAVLLPKEHISREDAPSFYNIESIARARLEAPKNDGAK